MKKLIIIIAILCGISAKAQTIPAAENTFSKVETWQLKDNNLFGELLKEDNTKMNVKVSKGNGSNGAHTYIIFKGDFVDGQSTNTIRSFQTVIGKDNIVSYRATCTDSFRKVVDCLLRYKDGNLIDVSIIMETTEGERCVTFTN